MNVIVGIVLSEISRGWGRGPGGLDLAVSPVSGLTSQVPWVSNEQVEVEERWHWISAIGL